jgi:hypothetical protein
MTHCARARHVHALETPRGSTPSIWLTRFVAITCVAAVSPSQMALRPGFTPLNWNSQRIPGFIDACNKAVAEFTGVVTQIHKSSAMIAEVTPP